MVEALSSMCLGCWKFRSLEKQHVAMLDKVPFPFHMFTLRNPALLPCEPKRAEMLDDSVPRVRARAREMLDVK